MAIINCPDCGQQVSSTAEACPGCGFPVAKKVKQKTTQRGCATVFLIVGAVMAIGILINANSNPGPSPPAAKADPVPLIGETWYAKGEPIGCRDEADLNRLSDLATQNDTAAFTKFYLAQNLAGRCRALALNTSVYIEKSAVFGHPCVRPKGDPYCLFVMKPFLQNSLPK